MKTSDKKCQCGRIATHFVALFTLEGEPTGEKKLMCDAFPDCKPLRAHPSS